MNHTSIADVAVVGGGVTGLSAAWWLAREGVDVVVLEKGIVGWEASGRNGGGCTHPMSALFEEEQRLWPQMDELLGYPTEYQRERIFLALEESRLELVNQRFADLRRKGYESRILSAKEVRERVPLVGDMICGGLHCLFGGHANPQRTAQAYAWAVQDHGGRVLQQTRVSAIHIQGNRAVGVETPSGRINCGHLVLAAGPQISGLLASIGVMLPTAPARAEMIVTEALPLMQLGGVDGNGLYGRQTLRGNLVYGGGPHEWLADDSLGSDACPSTPVLQSLALRLSQLFPKAGHIRLIRSWSGIIENTPDGRPVIERLASPSNVTVATMSSVGFGLSPATGHAIRDLVVDGRCSFTDLSKYSLNRFAGMSSDWRKQFGWVPGWSGSEVMR